jgi:Methyltransferase domain
MTDSALTGAAMWDERYRGEPYDYGLEPNAFLPGDGEGRNGVWLAAHGLEVDTLDLSAFGVEKAQRLAAHRGVSINAMQADALAWDWPEARYDLIALIFLHLVEPDRCRLHAKAVGALKPGGSSCSRRSAPNRSSARRSARAVARAIRRSSIRWRPCGRISKARISSRSRQWTPRWRRARSMSE